jgi:translocation and assembly module TamA
VFYDAGKAFNDSAEPVSAGAGVGARWRLPIGLLNFDVAKPLDMDGNHWRIHVSIGPEL